MRLYTAIRLQNLLNQQVHAILEEALTQLSGKYSELFPCSCAPAWDTVTDRLAIGDGIKPVRRTQAIVYQWAIAPQLTPHLNLSAPAIAQKLVALLTQVEAPQKGGLWCELRTTIWKACHVAIHADHLIQIEVGDRALTTWLQQLTTPSQEAIECLSPAVNRNDKLTANQWLPEDTFPIQAAHARCCSLLRLGAREGLITIHPTQEKFLPLQIVTPHPLPWLQNESQLRLSHPVERQSLKLAVEILGDRTTSLRQIKVLCEHFFSFEATCRILGQVKRDEPQLAQARLGLILLIRYCLAEWLNLQGIAPLQEL